MRQLIKYIFISFFATFLFGCNKENVQVPADFKYSYCHMAKGFTLLYDITEITIDDTMDIFDTVRYQLKERYDSLYYDNSGNPVWRLERYKRADANQNWIISDVWTAQIVDRQLQVVEENQRILKLVFPPTDGKQWNGNLYNMMGAQEYEITEVDVPSTINQFQFDSTLTVTIEDSESLINKYFRFNQYAKHVGLINYTNISIDYANIIPGIPIEDRIARGNMYFQKLIDYYNE